VRIAYLANYQGPELIARRPIAGNVSMAVRVKVQLVTEMLQSRGHEVVVISEGNVVDHQWKFYRSFVEPQQSHANIPVTYASALPIRRLNGLWSVLSTLRLLSKLHSEKPFDVVLILNMNWPQIAGATYAMRRLRRPVVVEYEDDAFASVHDDRRSPLSRAHRAACRQILKNASGGMAASPYLLAQLPRHGPRLLLRGVVGSDIIEAEQISHTKKRDWVAFAGTHIESNGVASLIQAWKQIDLPGWELHITGYGIQTPELQSLAAGVPNIVFHGLVDRSELVKILSSARICVNPHKVAARPGIVFAFKIVEYLAAGAHVITTRMGEIEPDLEGGITYLPDNAPQSIATVLRDVVQRRLYTRTAAVVAQRVYGPDAVTKALDHLLSQARVPAQHSQSVVSEAS